MISLPSPQELHLKKLLQGIFWIAGVTVLFAVLTAWIPLRELVGATLFFYGAGALVAILFAFAWWAFRPTAPLRGFRLKRIAMVAATAPCGRLYALVPIGALVFLRALVLV